MFTLGSCNGLPEPAARYLRHAIAPGARLGRRAWLAMHGTIKIGVWLPFQARQVIDSRSGFSWEAHLAGGLVRGSDQYDGVDAATRVEVAFVRMMAATGPDVARSAAGRFAAEMCAWMPGRLLLDPAVTLSSPDDQHVLVRTGHRDVVHLHVAGTGALLDVSLARWGRDGRRPYRPLPFGMEVDDERRFGDFTIPSAGRAGWWYGTPRWRTGEFFRFIVDEFRVD